MLRHDQDTATARRQVASSRNSDGAGRGGRKFPGLGWLETLALDLRFGLRQLARNPAFAGAAIVTLGLGIGANTAIFSVVDRLVLHPVPFVEADRLVLLWRARRTDELRIMPRLETVAFIREAARSFSDVQGFEPREFVATGGEEPEVIRGLHVSPSFPAFLGARPVLGRGFLPDEADPRAEPVALIGEGLWRRRFGGRSDVLGRTIVVDGKSRTIVGVLPDVLNRPLGAFFVETDGLWLPLVGGADEPAGEPRSVWGLARLRAGVPLERARREMDIVSERVSDADAAERDWKIEVTPVKELLAPTTRTMILVTLGAVVVVLLIACANVSHLLLARAAAREREIAVRAVLGAARGRLVRQLLVESSLVAVIGGALGGLLAWWTLSVIVRTRPPNLDELEVARLDARVFVFGMALSLATVVLVGLVPAFHATRCDLAASLRVGGGAAGVPRTRRFRGTLVAAEAALSLVLLVSAGLLVRSVYQLNRLEPGFAPSGLLTASVQLPPWRGVEPSASGAWFMSLLERVRAVPGVRSATMAMAAPPRYGIAFGKLEVEGGQASEAGALRPVAVNRVNPDYFRVLGVRVVQGRVFAERERNVAVVSRSLARRLWVGENPLGKRFRTDGRTWITVVGVADDVVALRGTTDGSRFQIHYPTSGPQSGQKLVIRAQGDPMSLVPALKRAVASLDPEIPLRDIARVDDELAKSTAGPRFAMALFGVFAALALALATVGLYGLISYTAVQRTREFGIRMALGASSRSILASVLAEGMRPALVGIAIGIGASLAVTPKLSSLLFAVSPHDAPTLSGVATLFAIIALLACWLPARRAAKAGPMVALRSE